MKHLNISPDLALPTDAATQPVATHEGRALGPVMLRASERGWIENTGRVKKSLAVSRHRAPKTIWRSRIRN